MDTYQIMLSGEKLNDYIEGRISGIIYALSGMPDMEHAVECMDDGSKVITFNCSEAQFHTIAMAINNVYGRVIDIKF